MSDGTTDFSNEDLVEHHKKGWHTKPTFGCPMCKGDAKTSSGIAYVSRETGALKEEVKKLIEEIDKVSTKAEELFSKTEDLLEIANNVINE